MELASNHDHEIVTFNDDYHYFAPSGGGFDFGEEIKRIIDVASKAEPNVNWNEVIDRELKELLRWFVTSMSSFQINGANIAFFIGGDDLECFINVPAVIKKSFNADGVNFESITKGICGRRSHLEGLRQELNATIDKLLNEIPDDSCCCDPDIASCECQSDL